MIKTKIENFIEETLTKHQTGEDHVEFRVKLTTESFNSYNEELGELGFVKPPVLAAANTDKEIATTASDLKAPVYKQIYAGYNIEVLSDQEADSISAVIFTASTNL